MTVKGKILSPAGEVLAGKILYDNSSGTTGTVVLNESAANFKYLEIYVLSTSDSAIGYSLNCTKINNPNGKSAILMSGYSSTSDFNLKMCIVLISDTSISRTYGSWEFSDSNHISTNYIGITRVIGYK